MGFLHKRPKKSLSTPGSTTGSSEDAAQQPEFIRDGDADANAATFPDGIKVWQNPSSPTVDICFIHGITGDRDRTWTARGKSEPWPKLLLTAKLPNARLLTFGYDAYVVGGEVSLNRLTDHANNLLNDLTISREDDDAVLRPLIFVVHSMGGLVCKEAILQSRNSPYLFLQHLFQSLKGIVFLGTPHQGSWMARWAIIPISAIGVVNFANKLWFLYHRCLLRINKSLPQISKSHQQIEESLTQISNSLPQINKSLLQILQTDDQLLESLHVKFLAMIHQLRDEGRDIEIVCFFEELPLPLFGTVVSKESATLPSYNVQGIRATHSDMVKFSTAEEDGFVRVFESLRMWELQVR
ncbi:hypothetical protein IMZ48_08295 [Candidatus Bathyarchaeota archaeon]|nr:hypothetical protein [Candidatus Bathyarchaeota archaeon]